MLQCIQYIIPDILPQSLNIKYLNVQHFNREKEAALIRHITEKNPDIILVTSTGRKRDQPIRITGYNTFACNKNNEIHAGSAIAIKWGIKFKILNNFISDTIGAQVETSKGPIIVMTTYSPPRYILLPQQDLQYMIRNQYPVIMAADLNARHSTFGYRSSNNTKGRHLNEHVMRGRLNYIGPNFCTYFTNRSATKPDCVLTNNRFFLNHHIYSGGLGPSDHLTINIVISTNPIYVPCEPIQNIHKVDWENYKKELAEVTDINLDGKTALDIQNGFSKIYEIINKAKDNNTPIKTIQIKNNIKTTSKFKRLSKVLNKYSEQLRNNGRITEHLQRNIQNIKLALIQEGNQCKYEWWENQIEKIEKAAKYNSKFWRKIKQFTGGKRQETPNLINRVGNINIIAKTDEEKTNMFTGIWENICQITPEENQNFCANTEQRVENTLNRNMTKITPKWKINLQEIRNNNNKLPIDEWDVIMAIKSIPNKTPGPSKLKKNIF